MANLVLLDAIKGVGSKLIFGVKKHSPEILVVTGIASAVVGTVLACRATLKAPAILEEAKEQLEKIHECANNEELADKYTREDAAKDTALVYIQTGAKLLKIYGPALAFGALSVASILGGTNILRKRTVALAAAYTTLDTGFKNYRNKVVEKFGEDVDKQLRFNLQEEEVKEKVVDEEGKTKTVKSKIKTVDPDDPSLHSMYARIFDCSSPYWTNDAEYNLMFLRAQQSYFNHKLQTEHTVILNDVYDALGIPKTKTGQVVGWVYDPKNPDHDNYIDFGIYDACNSKARDFVNGYEKVIWIDPNVDGYILGKVDWEQ